MSKCENTVTPKSSDPYLNDDIRALLNRLSKDIECEKKEHKRQIKENKRKHIIEEHRNSKIKESNGNLTKKIDVIISLDMGFIGNCEYCPFRRYDIGVGRMCDLSGRFVEDYEDKCPMKLYNGDEK